jgi:hypothetical protein
MWKEYGQNTQNITYSEISAFSAVPVQVCSILQARILPPCVPRIEAKIQCFLYQNRNQDLLEEMDTVKTEFL